LGLLMVALTSLGEVVSPPAERLAQQRGWRAAADRVRLPFAWCATS
jgi:hypothetical protein